MGKLNNGWRKPFGFINHVKSIKQDLRFVKRVFMPHKKRCRNCKKVSYLTVNGLCPECVSLFRCAACGIICAPGYGYQELEKRKKVGKFLLCRGCFKTLKNKGRVLIGINYLLRSGVEVRKVPEPIEIALDK